MVILYNYLAAAGVFSMSLQALKEQAFQLSVGDRLILVSAIIQPLQGVSQIENWQYLVPRPHPWRTQLYIKGRKIDVITANAAGLMNRLDAVVLDHARQDERVLLTRNFKPQKCTVIGIVESNFQKGNGYG
jgi:hypothetical protein